MAHDQKAAIACPPCETTTLSRNNYFTGKLMVERDFTDEQRFFMEKIRLHHQRLHGHGVVCGLELKQHPNPACRNRYVLLEPGSAIDCCGRDTLVVSEDTIDLQSFEAVAALADENPPVEHTLAFCIRYAECPTEDIPVLYDECGCDDTLCAPNRILESYSVDVQVDPPAAAAALVDPKLDWAATVGIARAGWVVLHEATQRLYVMTDASSATIYQVDAANLSVTASLSLGRKAYDLAVSPDGKQLYVALDAETDPTKNPRELGVIDTSGPATLAGGFGRHDDIPNSKGAGVRLAVVDDGRVVAAIDNGWIKTWAAGVPKVKTIAASKNLGVPLGDVSVASDGDHVYIDEPGKAVHRIDLGASDLDPSAINVSGVAPELLQVVRSTSPDLLAVTDGKALKLLDPAKSTVLGTVSLAHDPVDLVVGEGGQFAYVVVDDGTGSYVQAVDLQNLLAGATVSAGAPYAVGERSQRSAITSSGRRLFAAYLGAKSDDTAGGVAIVDIDEADCCARLDPHDCPSCDDPDCVVLAVVQRYKAGRALLDEADPAPAPDEDAKKDIARIDNSARTVLPSTQAIAEVVRCLCERGVGGGKQGLPGEKGDKGDPGAGIDQDLPHICDINWGHGSVLAPSDLKDGLVIAFDKDVRAGDIDAHSCRLLCGRSTQEDAARTCWCEIPITVQPITLAPPGKVSSAKTKVTALDAAANGARLQLPSNYPLESDAQLRVIVRGDFIRERLNDGTFDKSLDADHVAPWFPKTQKSTNNYHSGNGLPGGTFESWFDLKGK